MAKGTVETGDAGYGPYVTLGDTSNGGVLRVQRNNSRSAYPHINREDVTYHFATSDRNLAFTEEQILALFTEFIKMVEESERLRNG